MAGFLALQLLGCSQFCCSSHFGLSAPRRRLQDALKRSQTACVSWRKKFAGRKKLCAICALILMSASGCAINSADSFCLIAQPILTDPEKDTEETLRQIDEHNLIGEAICEW